jgi:hypothetical protein
MTQSNKIKELLFNLRKRGVRIRQITEITKDNVIYCKQVMEIVELPASGTCQRWYGIER